MLERNDGGQRRGRSVSEVKTTDTRNPNSSRSHVYKPDAHSNLLQKPPCSIMARRLAAGRGRLPLGLLRRIVALEGASAARLWFLMRMQHYTKQVRSGVRMSAAFVPSDNAVWFLQTAKRLSGVCPSRVSLDPADRSRSRINTALNQDATFLSDTLICTFMSVCNFVHWSPAVV